MQKVYNVKYDMSIVSCYSILSRRALKGASFTSPRQLREAIDRFVAVYNKTAAPMEWKKTRVYPKHLKQYYANL